MSPASAGSARRGACHARVPRWSALVVLLLVAVGLLVLPPRTAVAHAELIESTPADGAVVDASPTAIVLRFSENVSPLDGGTHVVDASGAAVAGEVEAEGDTIHIVVPATLPDGSYLVTWGIISADSHPIRGSFVFHIGAPGEPITVASPSSGVPLWLDIAPPAARWLAYAAALLAGGLAVFLALAHDSRARELGRLTALGAVAALAGLASIPVLLALQAADIAGGASGFSDGGAWDAAFASSIGDQSLALSAGLGLLLAGFLLRLGRIAHAVGIAGLGVAAWGFALSGHSATADPRLAAIVASAVHAGAAAVWTGGLVGLAIVLTARRGEDGTAAPVVRRFSRLALTAVLVVAAAGVVLALIEVPSWGALTSERYGQLLLAKATLVLAIVAIAAYNRRRLIPGRARSAPARGLLRTTVRAEVAAIAIVLALTAVLVAQDPEPSSASRNGNAETATLVRDGFLGDYHVVLTVSPGSGGERTIEVVFHAFGDADPATIQSVDLELSLAERDIGPLRREMPAVAPGVYRLVSSDLLVAGEWSLRVLARVSDFEQETLAFDLPIGTEG